MKFLLSFFILLSSTAHSQWQNSSKYGDCDFKLPDGYELLYNHTTKEYVIGANKWFGIHYHYLIFTDGGRGSFFSMLGTIDEAIKFKDSCNAKGFAHQYFIQQEDESQRVRRKFTEDSIKNDFQPIKH